MNYFFDAIKNKQQKKYFGLVVHLKKIFLHSMTVVSVRGQSRTTN